MYQEGGWKGVDAGDYLDVLVALVWNASKQSWLLNLSGEGNL